ncbi:MAG: hypothetical protein KJZ78_00680 [Bryobacteraceae bacterium]|nr:hypothetical protein [Bryobacteraceae bacterium]
MRALLICCFCVVPLLPAAPRKIIFGSPSANLADFERFVVRAAQSGATHINITAEDLPWSYWQYDMPGDPYPSWVISNVGLLKIATPEALQPYLPRDYAESVMNILEARCRVLRKLGLKAAISTFEPQMLPEAVFEKYPLWRGARVDHPNRSRVPRFAPTVDHPDVRRLYRESLGILIRRCPEIEMLSLHTNDSGTGMDWSGGLYSGRFGNTLFRNRSMEVRYHDFFAALRDGAKDAGGSLEIDMIWTREPDPMQVVRKLAPGMAIENREGPDGTPFKSTCGYLLDYHNAFYPVRGIPQPQAFLEGLEQAAGSKAPRLEVLLGDSLNRDLYFEIYDRFRKLAPSEAGSRTGLLREVAAVRAGTANADRLLAAWENIREAEKLGQLLNSGGTIFYLGSVQQRWLTRPFVPFPAELKPEEKVYYRKFQFQARSEEHANDLADLQANALFSGWGASRLTGRILSRMEDHIRQARKSVESLQDLSDGRKAVPEVLYKRLDAFLCLIRNARNAVNYQAQLDRAVRLQIKPERSPVSGTQSGWDRQLMLETARAEIDNTAVLIEVLQSSPEVILHLAANPSEEDIRVLGPDLVAQLRKKLAIMNAHWEDYERLFTTPNM